MFNAVRRERRTLHRINISNKELYLKSTVPFVLFFCFYNGYVSDRDTRLLVNDIGDLG